MRKTVTMRLAVGLLLVGVLVGIAGAQAVQNLSPTRYIDTGPFTLARGEGVSFHVALDAPKTAPAARVLLQLFNGDGAVVAQDEVMLQAGQTTTLQMDKPGLYRAHARVIDPDLPLGIRRSVVATAEIIDDLKANRRFVCSHHDDNADPIRPQ